MRKIKFRAWDKTDGQMYYAIEDGIEFDDKSNYEFRHFLTLREGDYHKWEVMQFTGLLDKNGKEIYEGDIFKCNYCDKDLFEIYYDEDDAKFNKRLIKGKGCGNVHCIHMTDFKRSEIIGNIYSNPELINISI